MLKRGIGASRLGNSGNGKEKWEETKRLVACLVENSSNSVAYIIPSSLLLIILHSLVPDAHAIIYTISKKVAIPYFSRTHKNALPINVPGNRKLYESISLLQRVIST